MQKKEQNQGVSVSFLDVIACAFGAIVLLVVILPIGSSSVDKPSATDAFSMSQLLLLSETIDADLARLLNEIAENRSLALSIADDAKSIADANESLAATIMHTRSEWDKTKAQTEQLARILETQEMPSGSDFNEVATELSGIPVDADYLAFVIDTSGSMQGIWGPVIREVERMWMLYPELKGFQILSDNGHYLQRGSEKRWIPDSPVNRLKAITQIGNWSAYSNSSPVEGITTAINDLYLGGQKMAIVVVGDDYNGSRFEGLFDEIEAQVENRTVGEGTLRIHALGFWNPGGSGAPRNFTILMRELTRRYHGAFVALDPNALSFPVQ